MPRFKLTIEYDGTPYFGWQRQHDDISVQQEIETAITKFAQVEARIQCAGRTDTGVHAAGQVAHVDLPENRTDPYTIREAINFHLIPQPIVVLKAEPVADDFNARFDAIRRAYRYRIINRQPRLTFDTTRAWHVPYKLDDTPMHEACRLLTGTHDFTSFRSSICQGKSPVKTIEKFTLTRHGEEVWVDIEARSFLHHQVRNLVGTLMLVGQGKWSVADIQKALDARDRRAGGPTAPPGGLTFMRVDYPTK